MNAKVRPRKDHPWKKNAWNTKHPTEFDHKRIWEDHDGYKRLPIDLDPIDEQMILDKASAGKLESIDEI